MKTAGTKFLGLAVVCMVIGFAIMFHGAAASAQDTTDVSGIWQGTLSVPPTTLRLIFKIKKNPDGTLTSTIDSPDQGATDIPVEKTTFENGVLTLDVTIVGGTFEGRLSEDGEGLDGEWTQLGQTLELSMERVDEPTKLARPQEPEKPLPYLSEDVTYESASGGATIAGTLTMPKGGGPFPAVLLVSGSGPQDRDETIFGHRPFLVLSDYLTRQGIAVLRTDDRGIGKSTGNFADATTLDFAEDARAGIAYLKGRKEIDSHKIGIVGHSEGGLIAPIVATETPDVAYIVMLAGPGLPGEDILRAQSELLARASGESEEAIERDRETQQKVFAVVKSETDAETARKELDRLLTEAIEKLSDAEKAKLGDVESYKHRQIDQVLSPWFRFFLTYDPRPTLRKVKCPVLAVIGSKDVQVPAKANLDAIADALKAGGNDNVTIRELPGLNHLFQTAKTGAPSEYSTIEETMSPSALQLIADWIRRQTS
jgi:pimeloyl-ACP methyl ester carboxylesterase